MIKYKVLYICIICICSLPITCKQDEFRSLVITDFNTASYETWTAEGTAFEGGPAGGEETHHMVGSLGDGFAASTGKSEAAVGSLTSPVFTIERSSIHFLIGSHELFFLPGGKTYAGKLALQLLVDEKVVRSAVPIEFHAMFWQGWDVSDLKGKQARLRIIDKDNRPWAHIDIDQIIQSDLPVEGIYRQRTLNVSKPVLNMPVREGASRYYLELLVDGKQVRGMDVELADEETDYWVVTDLDPWLGKEIIIRTRQNNPLGSPNILDRFVMADNILDSEDLYREQLRPQFHFSAKRGWINDPNGLVYYDGEYHLFYQANPYGWDHSRNDYNKTWGHAVSSDLVHWTELPASIHPDHLGPIYSGSAVVDEFNTTGFQSSEEKPIVCVYTSAGGRSPWSLQHKFTQSIAYSNDRGKTFEIYQNNPVQENIDYINRDPKAIWYEPNKEWVIVLHFDERAMAFFTSKDLKTWEFQSELETPVQDCPELFQLAVDGDKQNKKWILYGGSGHYLIGVFDGKEFRPETKETQFSYGNCFYASQTFNNIPEKDGRRIQMAWGRIPTEGMPFNQTLLFPVELTLRTTEQGLKMFAYPVEEIENIRQKTLTWKRLELKPGQNILSDIEGELFDIDAEFDVGNADAFGFKINGYTVTYDCKNQQLSYGEQTADLEPVDGKIRLRILVDRISIEIFGNDGRIYMPNRALPTKTKGLEIFTKGGGTSLPSLNVYKLRSIWQGAN